MKIKTIYELQRSFRIADDKLEINPREKEIHLWV